MDEISSDLNVDISNVFALVYEDDGPLGLCGQAMSITSPWKKLYIFESEDKMREVVERV